MSRKGLKFFAGLATILAFSGPFLMPSSNSMAITQAPGGGAIPAALTALPASTGPDGPGVASAKPVLRLFDAGAEPRQALRYKWVKGAEQLLYATYLTRQDASMGEIKLPTGMNQALTTAMKVVVSDAGAKKSTVTLEIVGSEISANEDGDSPMNAMLKPAMKGMIGIRWTQELSARGETLSSQVKLPGKVDPMIAQMFESFKGNFSEMTTMFPEEPVGLGGWWTITSTQGGMGLSFRLTRTVTVDKIEGDAVTLSTVLSSEAGKQEMKLPAGMSLPGMKMEMLSLRLAGRSSTVTSLQKVLPESSSIDMFTDSEMSFTTDMPGMPEGPKTVVSTMTTKIRLSAAKPDLAPKVIVPAEAPAKK